MTIKQINDASQPHPDADFRSDGEPFGQVSFLKISDLALRDD